MIAAQDGKTGGAGPVLVTGGAGFIGSNLVDRLAADGEQVVVFDSLERPGVERNLAWLKARHPRKITAVTADIRDEGAVREAAAEASAVFHLAAQVAVTTSLDDPRMDFDVNVRGTLNLLEALRLRGGAVPLVFASTNKVYGDLAAVGFERNADRVVPREKGVAENGFAEDRPLDFHTPYGCSKGAADQYVLDYARSFGVSTAVLRMSCIYGPRQMGTEDQGWVAHFVKRALAGEPIVIFGDGRQVRDVLFVGDAVEAYLAARRRIASVSGRAFNLGGGPENAVSLLHVIAAIEELLGSTVDVTFADWRPGDQLYYVSDIRTVRRELELPPPKPWREGLATLVAWLSEEAEGARPAPITARAVVAAEARP
jgi:CDP-paratose 2-epimerase